MLPERHAARRERGATVLAAKRVIVPGGGAVFVQCGVVAPPAFGEAPTSTALPTTEECEASSTWEEVEERGASSGTTDLYPLADCPSFHLFSQQHSSRTIINAASQNVKRKSTDLQQPPELHECEREKNKCAGVLISCSRLKGSSLTGVEWSRAEAAGEITWVGCLREREGEREIEKERGRDIFTNMSWGGEGDGKGEEEEEEEEEDGIYSRLFASLFCICVCQMPLLSNMAGRITDNNRVLPQ
ncbi:unnamed protein product [Pleuronectes platessa]|uniref:Uncharacterized protein n=1 Tax=Pleuronectes platessa TaxID=8262 RepID=A0A9N7YRR3_PLEPL|nr:unnamed protein product [Pleuronectes platessa]